VNAAPGYDMMILECSTLEGFFLTCKHLTNMKNLDRDKLFSSSVSDEEKKTDNIGTYD
jgi:hypothetical protein